MKRVVKHENIYGMSRIGFVHVKSKEQYEVYVNTDDGGNIPHFHFRDKDDWDKFHTCIRIDKAEYFLHEGTDDILNQKLKNALQKFMISKPPKEFGNYKNNWEFVCKQWNANNSNVMIMISDDTTQPDYTKLK